MTLLIFLSESASPASRSFTLPACQLLTNVWNVSWYAGPEADGGVVDELEFAKMSRNTLKSGSPCSVGSARDAVVVGMFLIRLASLLIALSSVVRYLISSQAASGFLAFLEMPTMLPVT